MRIGEVPLGGNTVFWFRAREYQIVSRFATDRFPQTRAIVVAAFGGRWQPRGSVKMTCGGTRRVRKLKRMGAEIRFAGNRRIRGGRSRPWHPTGQRRAACWAP